MSAILLRNFVAGRPPSSNPGPKVLAPKDFLAAAPEPPVEALARGGGGGGGGGGAAAAAALSLADVELVPLTPRDTLMSLSLRFGVSEGDLMLANDLTSANLATLGGVARVPRGGARALPKPRAAAESARATARRVRVATGCDEKTAAYYAAEYGDADAAIAAVRNDDAFEAAAGGASAGGASAGGGGGGGAAGARSRAPAPRVADAEERTPLVGGGAGDDARAGSALRRRPGARAP